MSKAPTIRQVAWVAILPQMAILGLILALLVLLTDLPPFRAVWMGALLYLVYSRGSRALVARSHLTGMARVRRGDFKGAIPYFQASYRFFSKHPLVDRFRYLFLASASKITYREMALVNIAFCYGRIGDARQSREYYERALAEFPNSKLARAGLAQLKSAKTPQSEHGAR